MEPLGCCWESFGNLSGTFGSLLENGSKIILKVAEFYQKSSKGDPKVEEGSSKTVCRTPPPGGLLSIIGFVFLFVKDARTGEKNQTRFCPSSIAPATLLEVRSNSLKNPNVAKV